MRYLLALGLALAACGDDGGDAPPASEHPSRLRVRVAVADANAPEVVVYDVADREVVGRVALERPAASLVASYTGETAIVVQPEAVARVLSGGVSVIPHKDHIHIFKSAAQLLGPPLAPPPEAEATGAAPLFGDAKWSIVYRGPTGAVATFAEDPWLQAKTDVARAASGAARSVAVAHAGAILAGGASGVDLVAPDASPSSLSSCPEVELAASNGSAATFTCRDGFVVVGADRVAGAVIPFPDAPARKGLAGLHRQALMLALGAPAKLTIVDTDARAAFAIDAEPDLCDATLEIGSGPYATVLTASGAVVRYDVAARRRLTSTPVTAPFDCDAPVRPSLAATPGRAWVSSPATGELVEVDTIAGREARRIALGGAPRAVAVLGLDARNADLGTANDDLSE
ncbi:MAG: hypothetical protein KIT84_40895 [Labilithrix sp.]|nr:hypothetical protein [Labilithrix sp.]MCW5817428.1 hypothetical protein [Labilithrix sp.]